ncbi:hypothetical protein E2C01_007995 [Portunus trituberculatus]|uniref:Uncharacterized protein n=1 Tax=Portunus trituberculatus TaxID=210409 RepID=A0A5B7D0G1_PORTR|nr:hypothetical protein [Portunus trituberculatus]
MSANNIKNCDFLREEGEGTRLEQVVGSLLLLLEGTYTSTWLSHPPFTHPLRPFSFPPFTQ